MTTTAVLDVPAPAEAAEDEPSGLTLTANSADAPSPLTGLAEELRRQLETKRDLKADTRRVSLDPETAGTLVVDMPTGAEDYTLTDHAHGQLCTHLEIGSKLYKRLRSKHPDLLAGLVNPLFCREPSLRLIRTMDGKARAFLSDTYRPRDNWDLLDQAILPAIHDLPEATRRGLYSAFFSKCRDLVSATLNETVFQAIVQQMRDLADIPIEAQPVAAVEEITRRHDLSQAEGDSILTTLLSGQNGLGLTGWAMVNSITQTARDLRSADRRADLETLAGKMIADPTLVTV
jgi:hypothetical protein